MFAFISLAALAVASAHTKAPEPIGSLQGLISADDYPAEALDHNQQGEVGVLVRVDATGAVSDCTIENSASAILDARTCELIRLRAKFKPARDRRGRPIASETHSRITWRIAEGVPQPSEPWASTAIMSYAPNGNPLSCRVELEGALKPTPSAEPQKCAFGPLPTEFRQLGLISTVTVGRRFALGPIPAPHLGDGDVLTGRMVLALQIDAAGKVDYCNVIDASAGMRGADGCKLIAGESFVPRKGPDGQPEAFSASLEFTNILHLQTPAPTTQFP